MKKPSSKFLNAMTIPTFCARQQISRTTYYELRKAKLGPKEMKFLGRGIRISRAAERAWIAMMEERTSPNDRNR